MCKVADSAEQLCSTDGIDQIFTAWNSSLEILQKHRLVNWELYYIPTIFSYIVIHFYSRTNGIYVLIFNNNKKYTSICSCLFNVFYVQIKQRGKIHFFSKYILSKEFISILIWILNVTFFFSRQKKGVHYMKQPCLERWRQYAFCLKQVNLIYRKH